MTLPFATLERVLPNHKDHLRHAPAPPRGMTLFELVVVIALLGLASALATPAILTAKPKTSSAGDVVARARDVAVARGQRVELTVASDGSWRVRTSPQGDSILGGQLDQRPPSALAVVFTPFGACAAIPPTPHSVAVHGSPCSLPR